MRRLFQGRFLGWRKQICQHATFLKLMENEAALENTLEKAV